MLEIVENPKKYTFSRTLPIKKKYTLNQKWLEMTVFPLSMLSYWIRIPGVDQIFQY